MAIKILGQVLLLGASSQAWILQRTPSPFLFRSTSRREKLRNQPWICPRSNHCDSLQMNSQNDNNNDDHMGLNELQTLLRNAVLKQDFSEAGRLSDMLVTRLFGPQDKVDEETRRLRRRQMSWRGQGAAPWLVERLDSLNYTFPTTIQINAMQAVNAILNTTDEELAESTSLEERIDQKQKENDDENSSNNMGIVISGNTGSGKTLGYLVPMLSTLSDSLFNRQRIRVGWEESVGDTMGDLMERVAVVTSPVVRSRARKQIRQKGAIATGASLATLGKSGKDVKTPLALIVVPGKELGVQIAMLLYQLVGGNIKQDATELSGKANMFKYKGPKGIRIGCVLDQEEAEFGLKLQTDVAITTPEFLGKLLKDEDIVPSKLRVVIYDEADLALEDTDAKDLSKLFDEDEREFSRVTFLVGASVTESLGKLAVSSLVIPEGKSYIASATRYAPLVVAEHSKDDDRTTVLDAKGNIVGDQPKTASLKDLDVCLDPGLRHERVVVGNKDTSSLLVLTRLLRHELEEYDRNKQINPQLGRPKVVVFFPDEMQARSAIEPLRDSLWGEHKLCVLLPKTGFNPLTIMEQFKKGETSVMLATPNSVRGLDFPAVTHVYTLYLPIDDPREYVHLAGRVGRIGQMGSVLGGGGRVISVLKEGDEADQMEVLAQTLGFEFTDRPPIEEDGVKRSEDGSVDVEGTDVENLRRYLEDTISLVSLADDPTTIDITTSTSSSATSGGYDEDGDEEVEDDESDSDNEQKQDEGWQ